MAPAMSNDLGQIQTLRDGNVLEIVIDRPKTKNALTIAMYADLTRAVEAAVADPEVLAILLRGEGGNFSSGNDLRDFLENPPKGPEATVFRFMKAVADCPKPVIAAVEGFAVGIGTTILFHCDLVYASADAKFLMPFVNLALVPEAGSTMLLTNQVGLRRAAELLYFGEPFDAGTAREVGLVSAILEPENVLSHARARAKKLVAQSPTAVRKTKALLTGHQAAPLSAHIDAEADVFVSLLGTPEVEEAIRAVLEKRKPDFAKLRG